MFRFAAAAAAALWALAITAPVTSAERAERTPLEWLLDAPLTGTRVLPRSTARFYWRSAGGTAIAEVDPDVGAVARLSDASSARLRVAVTNSTAAVAVYVERVDLTPVATRAAIVCPARACALGAHAWDTPGVHLEPGDRIAAIRARRGRVTRVAVADGALAATGWIDSGKIGDEYRPQARAPVRALAERGLGGVTALRARPGGGPIVARLVAPPKETVTVGLVRTEGAHALVRYAGDHAVAVGWVPVSALRAEVWGGLGGLGLIGGGHRMPVPRGTVLFDAKRGAPVGLLVRDARLSVGARDGRWMAATVPTGLGRLELWISGERMTLEP